jgi:soluble lytic murein transglycosylase-like protein
MKLVVVCAFALLSAWGLSPLAASDGLVKTVAASDDSRLLGSAQAEHAGLLRVSDKARQIARRLDATGYYSRMSRAYKGYPHLRSKQSASLRRGSVSTGIDSANRQRFRSRLRQIARAHRLAPELLDAVIRVESGYEPSAVSPKGAMGLMQLMPDTAARFAIANPLDPVENMRGGARYLRWLMDRFDGELELVLAAYNAGEGAVERYGNRIPPYDETRAYVARVLQIYQPERP